MDSKYQGGSTNYKYLFLFASCIGLITGFVEAILLYYLQSQQMLDGNIIFLGGGLEIFWLSPLACAILFVFLGAIFSLIAKIFPKMPVFQIALFVFLGLMVFDWLFIPLSGRISIYAVMLLAVGVAVQLGRLSIKYSHYLIIQSKKYLPILVSTLVVVFITIQGGKVLYEYVDTKKLPVASPNTPNILVILIDTLRADHLSGYRYTRDTSPNMDRIAERGVLFENAISPSSWTQPAHASLLTGRYPHEHGADNARMDDRYPTISEQLQNMGYRTAAFSANYEVFNKVDGFGRGFVHFEDYYQSIKNLVVNSFYGRFIEFYIMHRMFDMPYRYDRRLAEHINQSVLDWIGQSQQEPFFVFINYYDVHAPYIPPQPYRSMFSDKPEPGGRISTDWGMEQIYIGLTREEIQDEIDSYDGAIAYVDDQIQLLIDELVKREIIENTVIVILSDHGESFGEHNLLEHHNSLYKEIIQVPLIISWPGHIPENLSIDTPVSLVSLTATLMDFAGAGVQNVFPYTSLSPLWIGQTDKYDWPTPLSESVQVWWVPPQHLSYHGAMKSIYSSEAHYINHEKFGEELYGWKTDPQEINNLAGINESQSTIDNFRKYLERILKTNDLGGS